MVRLLKIAAEALVRHLGGGYFAEFGVWQNNPPPNRWARLQLQNLSYITMCKVGGEIHCFSYRGDILKSLGYTTLVYHWTPPVMITTPPPPSSPPLISSIFCVKMLIFLINCIGDYTLKIYKKNRYFHLISHFTCFFTLCTSFFNLNLWENFWKSTIKNIMYIWWINHGKLMPLCFHNILIIFLILRFQTFSKSKIQKS